MYLVEVFDVVVIPSSLLVEVEVLLEVTRTLSKSRLLRLTLVPSDLMPTPSRLLLVQIKPSPVIRYEYEQQTRQAQES